MHVAHLTLVDFRSYVGIDLEIPPGVSVFCGPNGQGKTNLVEAVDYVARQSSHRVSTDQPLVRSGAERAVVRAVVRRDGRELLVELEVNPGRANRVRVNKAPRPRARDALGILRTVVFSPDDLALVTGDPAERRRFLDELLTSRHPRFVGVRADYDRVLRQRNSLLKSAAATRGSAAPETLDAWDAHLAAHGAELTAARLDLVDALHDPVNSSYTAVSAGVEKPGGGNDADLRYSPSWPLKPDERDRAAIESALLDALRERRNDELDRGLTLVGPHRDDLLLSLGGLPARGYASHGESWSFALALRLASFELLRADGDDPVLILDDVFAELDRDRRSRLAGLVAGAEQVLVTVAVPDDVPDELGNHRFAVADGSVRRD